MKKKVTLNYIYSSFYQLVLIIVPFITAPYLARTLLPEAIGINSYVSAVVQVVSLIGLLGLNNYSIREIAYVRNDRKKLTKTFTELISLRFILFVITILLYFIYSMFSEYRIYFLVQLIAVFSSFLDISWLYAGLEEFKFTVTRSFIVKIINVISIFLFIKGPEDLCLFMIFSTIYTVIGNFLLYFGIRKRVDKITFKNVELTKHIKPTIMLFLPQVASLIYLQVDKIMIKELAPVITAVGFYDQAERIVKIPLALITALSSVMLPRVSNEFKNNNDDNVKRYINMAFTFSLLLSIPLMFGIFSISSTMIPWFLGIGYEEVIPIMMTLCPIVFFISLSSVCGGQYLTAVNNTKMLTKSYVLGACFNLLFNFILIPKLGGVGAAIGTVIAEFIVFIVQLIAIHNILDSKELIKSFFRYFCVGLVMLFVCVLVGYYFEPTIITTLLQIVVGVLVYFIILLVIRDKFVIGVFEKFLTILKKVLHLKKGGNI